MFTHEKFEAYQLSIEFNAIILQLIDEVPAQAALKDQLRRAANSISLNIAEGTGKTGRADRKRFYSIARGLAMECAAICDLIALLGKGKMEALTQEAKLKLKSIVSILSVICRAKD